MSDKPAIFGGTPTAKKRVPFTRIWIGEDELRATSEIVKKGRFVNGDYTKLLEKEFASYIGTKHAIAVSNGTDGLFLAYLALGLTFGKKIATTPYTFIATASTIIHTGAIPLFFDVDPWGNLDPKNIERSIDAISVVHLFGHPANLDGFLQIKRETGAFLIEDASHAHGAEYEGKKVGSFGDVAVFSLYPSKVIAAGGWGGVITTNNDEIAETIRLLQAHGEARVKIGAAGAYQYLRLGYNLRIAELEAAVAYYQLKKLDEFISERRRIAKIYFEELQGLECIKLPLEAPWAKHIYYIFSIIIDPSKCRWSRDKFVEALNAEGIDARRGYHTPLYRTELFQRINDPNINHFAHVNKYPDYSSLNLKNTEYLSANSVWIPLYPYMRDDDIDAVIKAIKKLISWGQKH